MKGGTSVILGISGSGRPDGITSQSVKFLLEATGEKYQYISLSDKKINGCIGCLHCAEDATCKQKDDWNEIGEKMLKADAIVFGAPNYYNNLNALAHACLERTFCFRHRETFKLAGKLGIAIGVDDSKEDPLITELLTKYMKSNHMAIVDEIQLKGYSQCYTCGYGENCAAGNVVNDHGFIDEIQKWHLPQDFSEQNRRIYELHKAGKILGSILRNQKNEGS